MAALPKNAIELSLFCRQFEISPTRYRRLANLGHLPQAEGKQIDFVKSSVALFKLAQAGEVYLDEYSQEGFGMSARRYRQLADEGKVPAVRNGMIKLGTAVPALISYYRGIASNHGDPSLTDERRRKTRAEANLRELEEKRISGELMERATVAEEFTNRVYSLKTDLLALPKRLAKWPEAKDTAHKYLIQLMRTYSRPLPGAWGINKPKKGGLKSGKG
jgi:hypothetical protein